MCIYNLPVEIISNVFDFLLLKDSLECLKVCKKWYNLASPACYKTIYFTGDYSSFLENTEKPHFNNQRIWNYIVHLKFKHNKGSSVLCQDDFKDLLSKLSQLESIDLCITTGTTIDYLKYLLKVPKHQLKNLNCIKISGGRLWNHSVLKAYYDTLDYLKDTITVLDMIDVRIESYHSESLSRFLCRFKNLKTIHIHRPFASDSRLAISLESIMTSCINLEYLTLQYKFTGNEFNTYNLAPCIKLKSISLNLEVLTDSFVNYMIRCLPNISHLQLNFATGSLGYLVTEDKKNYLKFACYLKRTSFEFYFDEYNLPNESVFQHLLFWDFLQCIYEEDMYCSLDLCFYGKIRRSFLKFDKTKKHILIGLNCYMQENELLPENWLEKINFFKFKSINIVNNAPKQLFDTWEMAYSLIDLMRERRLGKSNQITIRNGRDSLKAYLFPKKHCSIISSAQTSSNIQSEKTNNLKINVNDDLLKSIDIHWSNLRTIFIPAYLLKQSVLGFDEYILDLATLDDLNMLLFHSSVFLKIEPDEDLPYGVLVKYTLENSNDLFIFYTNSKMKIRNLSNQDIAISYKVKHKIKFYFNHLKKIVFKVQDNISNY